MDTEDKAIKIYLTTMENGNKGERTAKECFMRLAKNMRKFIRMGF